MNALLFTTSDMSGERARDLARLLAGVAGETPAVRHFLLLQRAGAREEGEIENMAGRGARILTVSERLGLSAARNRLIAAARSENAFEGRALAAFPDDDAFYPRGLLGRLAQLFSEEPELDLVACRCSLSPLGAFDPADMRPATASDLVRRTTSNTLFLRASLVPRLGPFDERLGLGTPARGGEDTEYILRAALAARRAGFIDKPLVGHPEASMDSAVRYYRGSLQAIARHAPRRLSLARELARKVAVGGYHVARGRLPAGEWGRACASLREPLRAGFGEAARFRAPSQ